MKRQYGGQANKSGIYQIRNLVDGKVYIGSCKTFKVRAKQHETQLTNCNHFNRHLQSAWNKHGGDVFLFKVLEIVNGEKKDRTKREEEILLELYYSGRWEECYNFNKHATQRWSKDPEQTKDILSRIMKNRWKDNNYRKQRVDYMLKFWQDPEKRCERIDAIKKSKAGLQAKKQREKISLASKKRWANPIWKAQTIRKISKTYRFQNPNGGIVTITNLNEFCRENGLKSPCMYRVANGSRLCYKGWRRV